MSKQNSPQILLLLVFLMLTGEGGVTKSVPCPLTNIYFNYIIHNQTTVTTIPDLLHLVIIKYVTRPGHGTTGGYF